MNKDLENKIILKYKNGLSSLKISKELNISKPTILKVLNNHGLVRKRDRCLSLKINKENDKYVIDRKCPKCNNIIKTYSKDKTIACRNHINKLQNNTLCKPCSLKLQEGAGNPFYGKKHNFETLKKISKSRTGKATGKDNCMSKSKWRKKSAEKLRDKWKSGEMEHTRKFMSEKLKETRRLGKIKSGITSKKEKEIIVFLKKLGFEVIHSFRVDTKICDIYIPHLNLIIEYFGDYWHCNPIKYNSEYFNQKKNMSAQEIWDYDSKKVDLIIKSGYNLEVIWEHDLKHDNEKIIQIITKYDKQTKFAPERS